MKIVTIKQALQYVGAHPEPKTDTYLELPVHELVCRMLFDIANTVDISNSGSMQRASVAQAMIFNRMVGRRHTGTHPSRGEQKDKLVFHDLTTHTLEKK